jgi:hypothetical protein
MDGSCADWPHIKEIDARLLKLTDLWKPRPSIRTTIHVFGRRMSGCSKALTYSYLRAMLSHGLVKDLGQYLEFAMMTGTISVCSPLELSLAVASLLSCCSAMLFSVRMLKLER